MKKSDNIKLIKTIVGKRYETLDLLKNDIEIVLNKNVETIIESESERIDELDYMIDFCLENDHEVYTIFYLRDNGGKYYITEI